MSSTRTLDFVWLVLLLATGATWFLGESGSAGPVAVVVMLAIALVKGWLVIREFMALRWVKLFWRMIVVGWLAVVLILIAFTYWLALT
jgi:caa(3)-type oxidase subunit IV